MPGGQAPLDAGVLAWTDASLAPAFWRPTRLEVESAWFGHVPFAHWIVAAHRPASIVELGTHNGVSYAAFCEAVLREGLPARAMAVDSFRGDEHAGFYGEDVLESLRRFHDQRYAGFSTLMQATFDEALAFVPDGSVDLLHIDGRHRYEDVSHDFASWRPKLSDRGVVLFHDTNVRERDFGVWRLWAELRESFAGFEFLHAYGLGVLAVGALVDGAVASLCGLRDGALIASVRARFALLGERWVAERSIFDARLETAGARQEANEIRAALAQTAEWGQVAQNEVNRLFPLNQKIEQAHRETRARLAQVQVELAQTQRLLTEAQGLRAEAEAELATLRAEAGGLRAQLDTADSRIADFERQRAVMLASTSWRVTAPLRRVVGLLRPGELRVYPQVAALAAPEEAEPAPVVRDVGGRPRALFVSGEDHTPGNAYRVERYAATARHLGFDASWKPVAFVSHADLIGMAFVVIWRAPITEHIERVIAISRDEGAAVIYDVDDLMFRPELGIAKIIDAIRVQRLSEDAVQAFYLRIFKALRECDVVTCPTEELAHQLHQLGRAATVLPNGFDEETHFSARQAMRDWADVKDDLLRIGYASGTRTHQRDFGVAVPAIARVMRENPRVRLTLFVDSSSGEGVVLANEFPELKDMADRIEWRALVPLAELPKELARFTINIAPLEVGNEFCEAKSELKFFEAALAGVPTVASPTGPFRRAILHDVTGMLAATEDDWYAALSVLLGDAEKRARMAQAAYHASLTLYGPEARAQAFALMLAQTRGGAEGAGAFERARYRATLQAYVPPHVPPSETVFLRDRRGAAEVTVIVPTYNYADYVVETLHSVAAQSVQAIDLVVIDDCSTDDSLQMVLNWAGAHEGRFNRIAVLKHRENAGLGFARNSGFGAAETAFVLPVDADNRLRPAACERLLAHIKGSDAAFCYPQIQQFGALDDLISHEPYSVLRLQPGNYIDAMALIRKQAWAAAGGYDHIRFGWEDFDFWCRLAERGYFGQAVPEVLADYRVHANSMLRTVTRSAETEGVLVAELTRRHPWLDLRNRALRT
jgi:glycosyltransferase involved in cell wall biosynthesis